MPWEFGFPLIDLIQKKEKKPREDVGMVENILFWNSPGFIRCFILPLEILDKMSKASPLKTPQNCVTLLGNLKA